MSDWMREIQRQLVSGMHYECVLQSFLHELPSPLLSVRSTPLTILTARSLAIARRCQVSIGALEATSKLLLRVF